ncbi:zinc metalloprotease [Nonomuraea longicatena]|uniref:Zinc metalloprotease n=1 Tax=Nonomuraea longicatena TaxID=83682 RepID=A0ABN1QID0_9ACTN
MARRATAVALVCLLAAGPARPSAITVGAEGAVTASGLSCARTAGAAPGRREPRPPGPGEVSEVLSDLADQRGGAPAPSRITVPTWVHVLTDGTKSVPDASVRAQIAILNAAYGGKHGGVDTGVRFRLDGITPVANTQWFADPLAHESIMKTRLRRGDARTLNLYIGQLSELVLGFSTYPFWYSGSPRLDGVVIDWRTLPGGTLRDFDRGFTGVHEIGHWLGLFHTFENGCEEPGDGVADTPPQGSPTEACPVGKDTCPRGGLDPVHNFMDYSHDRCMSEFTQGQAERMHEMWAAYRMKTAV